MPYQPLPDASLIQVEGNLDHRFRRALLRLMEGPEFNREFILSDVTGDFWRVFTEYCGDISGRYVGAVGLGRSYLNETCPLVDAVIEGIIQAQRADGHFNTEQPLDAINFPLAYGHGQLLKGLVDYYTLTPNPRLLQTIQRLTDYFCASHAAWRADEVVNNWEFIYYTNAIEGVVNAYCLTDDPRHLQLARDMTELLWDEPKHHSHSYLSSLLGILALYETTREPHYLDFVVAKRDQVAGMVTVDGGVTEMLPDKHVTEFCSVADWFMLNLRLWRVTQQTAYLGEAERILFNAVFFNQFSTGGFGTWKIDKANGYPGRVENGNWEAYWCCCFHGARCLYEALIHLYTWDETGVRVNLFFDSTVRLPHLGDVTLRQETDYPRAGRVKLSLSSPEPVPFALYLRTPEFARNLRLTVNGTSTPFLQTEGYGVITRIWSDADTVELTFDIGLHLEDLAGPIRTDRLAVGSELDGVTFRWGPILMGIDEMINCTGQNVDTNFWTAPNHLLLPPFENGICVLPRRDKLPMPPQWPGLHFETPASHSYPTENAPVEDIKQIVLTPLARVPEQQPHCAPSVRTRYQVKILSREDWEAIRQP
jgi:rhamnogalacturonyl hydrolase YesR